MRLAYPDGSPDLAILLNSVAWTPDGDYYWRFYRDGAVQRLLGGRERLGRDPHAWRARLKQRLKTARRVVLSTMPLWQRFGVPATARASLAVYNGQDDVDQLVAGLKTAMRLLG